MATKKHSGFEAPVYGTVAPKGSTIRRLENGRIEIVPPKEADKPAKKTGSTKKK